jgi:rod shape-determining protein MreC
VHDKQVRRRRAVLALLVGVSLILLTAYFGESPSSPLHSIQRGIVEVLSPVQDGASKVLSPFRDIAGWFSDTFNAKSEVKGLRTEVADLQHQVARDQQELINVPAATRQMALNASLNINQYQPVNAVVISKNPTLWYQTIEVDKGAEDSVHVGDPVLGDGALVGKVTLADSTVSIVTLLTDNTFGVAAEVQQQGSGQALTGDEGVLTPQVGNPNTLVLSDLPKPGPNQLGPELGDEVVTAGFTDPSNPALRDLYPAGIPIGTVQPVNENNLLNNGQIQVQPSANLRTLASVEIMTAPHASTQRAQVGP